MSPSNFFDRGSELDVQLAKRDYAPGKVDIPAFSVGSLTAASFECDITEHTDARTVIEVVIEASADGGKTWRTLGGFKRSGGIARGRYGTETTAGVWLGFSARKDQQIRASFVVAGLAVNTAAVLRCA